MRRIDFYRVKRRDNLGDPEFWNPRFEDIDLRLAEAESAMRVIDETAARAESAALSRINDVLTPLAAEAQERLTRVATIFEATSSSEVTFGEGIRQFLIPQGQRLTFAPLAYLIAFPTGDLSRYLTGRFVSYSHTSGILQIDVMRAVGEGMESDWQITPMAFASELEALADDVTAKAAATNADRGAVASDLTATNAARDAAIAAKGLAEVARDHAEARYASFATVYRGELASDPVDGEQGHWYFNTAQQMARVRGAESWGPLFSVSLGGIRQGDVTATPGQTTISVGSFTFMNVWRDGAKLVPGVDFTLASPNITLMTAATGGEVLSYLGYHSTDVTDFYTKEQVDAALTDRVPAGAKIIIGKKPILHPSNIIASPHNLLVAPWNNASGAATLSEGPIAPDGETYWTHVAEREGNQTHRVQYGFSAQTPIGVPYWFVSCAKAAERSISTAAIVSTNNSFATSINIDLLTGEVVNATGIGGDYDYRVWPGPNGSWIVALRGVASSLGNKNAIIGPRINSAFGSYVGDGSSGILAWGGQIQVGLDEPVSPYERLVDLGEIVSLNEKKQDASANLDAWSAIAPSAKADANATNMKWLGAGFTVSTAAPSGGVDGDFWFRREA